MSANPIVSVLRNIKPMAEISPKMTMKAVETAKVDGRWDAAYASPKNAVPPEDFLKELAKNKKAKAFFETLNKANVYSIVYRLHTARKPETREKRMKTILAMMEQKAKPFTLKLDSSWRSA